MIYMRRILSIHSPSIPSIFMCIIVTKKGLEIMRHLSRWSRIPRSSQLNELVNINSMFLLPVQNCIKAPTFVLDLEVRMRIGESICPEMCVDVDVGSTHQILHDVCNAVCQVKFVHPRCIGKATLVLLAVVVVEPDFSGECQLLTGQTL